MSDEAPLLCSNCQRFLQPRSKFTTGPYETRQQLRDAVNRMFFKEFKTGLEISDLLKISPSTVSRLLHGDIKQTTKE